MTGARSFVEAKNEKVGRWEKECQGWFELGCRPVGCGGGGGGRGRHRATGRHVARATGDKLNARHRTLGPSCYSHTLSRPHSIAPPGSDTQHENLHERSSPPNPPTTITTTTTTTPRPQSYLGHPIIHPQPHNHTTTTTHPHTSTAHPHSSSTISSSDLTPGFKHHHTHPHAQQHEATLTAALHRNADLAARLSALEPRLHTARDGAERALLDARMKEREWRAREKEMYQSLQPFSSPALYSRLVNAVADAEAVAEAMAESFLEEGGGDGRDVGEFVREYRALRKTYHLRRERKERWDEGRVGGWR
ncbi:hypothetical protein P167DRAFT_567593 [Morchella conica CCBAS932]|uniref:VPS37 C-terminal domain-containing protein n=1 Tax=Morchella conica CCBAS932 TaxID=1392247 RepID=A0A3N4KEE4_9PEZI|nr:hypothetical protein P167DRAFT_567593 [Morchella conica CCBAS932]